MTIDPQLTQQRREAALLAMRFITLARAGKPIAAAYVNNPPTPRIRWGYIGKSFTRES